MFTYYYQTLGLTPGCSESKLRERYLELVRQFPPESHPEQFANIHNAYEKVKNPLEMLPAILSPSQGDDSFDRVIQNVRENIRNRRLPTAVLLKMGSA